MASIVEYDGGLRRIEFSFGPNQPRKAVRLGRVSQKAAESFRLRVEAILSDRLQRRPHDGELASWLADLDETMLARLRLAGLADGVGVTDTTLAGFMTKYFETMTVKPATRTFYGHTRRCLEEFFGASKSLRDIGPSEADAWRAWLVDHEELSPATVARRVIAARTFWRSATRWKLTRANPFEGVKGGKQSNDARTVFVPREVIDKAIDVAPDTEWQVIIALARYAGLRTPSETFALRWGDIDFAEATMRVHASKTEHHDGGGVRLVPLFPEVERHLSRLFTEAEPGEYVIAKHRLNCGNLRTQFERILARAGVTAWPRLFHNLRGSRETELMREYDLATACKWIGNSREVAARHYAMSRDLDADFKRATENGEAQQKTQQSVADGPRQGETSTSRTDTENPENKAFVAACPAGSNAVGGGKWAIQDSNL